MRGSSRRSVSRCRRRRSTRRFSRLGRAAVRLEFGASVQQEVLPRTSVEVGYHRRWFQGFIVTDNLASTPADYRSTFTVASVASRRRRLQGHLLQPADELLGATNYTTFASDYGDQYQYWHGVDVNVNARLTNGFVVQGGNQHRGGACATTARSPRRFRSRCSRSRPPRGSSRRPVTSLSRG